MKSIVSKKLLVIRKIKGALPGIMRTLNKISGIETKKGLESKLRRAINQRFQEITPV